jgi:hypothetical protein
MVKKEPFKKVEWWMGLSLAAFFLILYKDISIVAFCSKLDP